MALFEQESNTAVQTPSGSMANDSVLRNCEFDAFAELATDLTGAPFSLIQLIGGEIYRSGSILDGSEYSICDELLHSILATESLVTFGDVHLARNVFTRDPSAESHPVPFFAAVQLLGERGCPIGLLCVGGVEDRCLDDSQARALKRLAALVARQWKLIRSVEILVNDRDNRDSLLSTAGVQTWTLELETGLVFAGADLCKIYGLTPNAQGLQAEQFFSRVHPADRERLVQANRISLETGQSTDLEFRILDGEGAVRWFSSKAFTEFGSEGEPQRLLGVLSEITVLKESELTQRIVQDRLERVLEGMPALVSYWTPELVLRFCNLQFAKWCDKSVAQLDGAHLDAITPPDLVDNTRRFAARVLRGKSQNFEHVFRNAEGQPKCYVFDLVPDFREGVVVGFFALGTDRTDRWKSLTNEKIHRGELQRVIDAMPISIMYWDANLVNRFVNSTSLKWFKRRRKEVEGMTAREVFGDEFFNRNMKRARAALNGKSQTFEKSIVTSDGAHRDAIFKFIPDYRDGEVVGFFAMITDVTHRRQAEVSLLRSRQQLRTVIDNIPAMIGYWTADLKNEFANKCYFESFGFSNDEIHGMQLERVVGSELFEKLRPYVDLVLSGRTQRFDRTAIGPDGETSHYQATLIPDIEKSRVKGFYSLEADITDRREAELSLMDEKERVRVTLNSIGDAVICTDCDGFITFLNPKAEQMAGWTLEQAKGKPLANVVRLHRGTHGMRDSDREEVGSEELGGSPQMYKLYDIHGKEYEVEQSASPILDALGKTIGSVVVLRDVSEANAMALKMAHIARHDSLTNLPNRLLLHERLQEAITAATQDGTRFSLVFLDLDHFKNINDSMGHAIGDELLKAISERLGGSIPACDTVSRQGGDEFILLLTSVDSSDHAGFVVQRLIHSLSKPYQVRLADNEQYKLSTSASAGIAMFPEDGIDPDTLMRRADVAMYLAKQAGRNRYQFFSPELDEAVIVRHSWLQDMREAIDNREFIVHYQPKVSTKDRSIVGVEALVRWQKSENKMIPPSDFIPLAEESGLIVEIGAQVLYEACRQCVEWAESGLAPIPVAVNVSAVQLANPGFVSFVFNVLEATKIPPALLELEITESSIMADVDKAAVVLHQLKDLGVKISLDDFGTGYSSLSYLRRFPLDCLKIDRSFVLDLTTNASTTAIMKTICTLGKTLNLQIVAEGVETEGQAELLCNLDCDSMQGYLFSKPVKSSIIGSMLPLLKQAERAA
jgi:diguanylate cyclase (GGDEF)-like protein/PAS domain S-box-containing protein